MTLEGSQALREQFRKEPMKDLLTGILLGVRLDIPPEEARRVAEIIIDRLEITPEEEANVPEDRGPYTFIGGEGVFDAIGRKFTADQVADLPRKRRYVTPWMEVQS